MKRRTACELDTLEYEESEGVAVVTLNRPEVHNAFNETMQRELRQVWQSLRGNDAVRAVVLTGAGERAFCTGIDRGEVPTTEAEYYFDPYTYEDPGENIGPRSQGLWKPVIAAVNGMAAGGAFYLLGESDFIIASENATFFDPHVTYGMPAVFEPALMASRMPFGDLMRMTLMGTHERISARKAEMMGMVTQVVAAGELSQVARGVAATIATQPPAAVQASLRTIWATRDARGGQVTELGNVFLNLAMSVEALGQGQETFRNRRPEPPTVR